MIDHKELAGSSDPSNPPPWRVGRKVGRTIYDADDVLIGLMDTPELAALVVASVNTQREKSTTS